MKDLMLQNNIEQKIYLIRGQKVMLDRDLALLYGVSIKRLNEQVKRNKKRFPEDFMFRLNREENNRLRSQIATLTEKKIDIYQPYAFTEHGILMLSSVLNSEKAIQVNIQIMRTFIKLRNILAEHKDILRKIENMEKKYDDKFKIIFETIRKMQLVKLNPPNPPAGGPRKQIGFHK